VRLLQFPTFALCANRYRGRSLLQPSCGLQHLGLLLLPLILALVDACRVVVTDQLVAHVISDNLRQSAVGIVICDAASNWEWPPQWAVLAVVIYSQAQAIVYFGVCPYTYVNLRPSVHKKFFSDFNEIWYVDRGLWVIHDGMPCDSIQGQCNGGPKFAEMADFKVYLLRRFASNQKTPGQCLNFNQTDFWYSSPFDVTWPSNLRMGVPSLANEFCPLRGVELNFRFLISTLFCKWSAFWSDWH